MRLPTLHLALTLLTLVPSGARAEAPIARTQPDQVPPITRHALIVTHASKVFDPEGTIAAGVDRLVREFKAAGSPVIYLMNDDGQSDATWLASDREPDFAIDARDGDHDLKYRAGELTIAGGFLSLCESRTVSAAADSYFKGRSRGQFEVHYPLDATYEERYAFAVTARGEEWARIWALEGPVTLGALFTAGGPAAFARALPELHIVDEDRYRISASVNGHVLRSWGGGRRRVLLDFRE